LGLFIVLILNAVHYNKLNYDILNERWGNENKKTKQRKGAAVFIYIILSVLLVIVLIIWRATTK
jgi:hypothetical protein